MNENNDHEYDTIAVRELSEMRYRGMRVRYGVITAISLTLIGINGYALLQEISLIPMLFLALVLAVWLNASRKFYRARMIHLYIVGE